MIMYEVNNIYNADSYKAIAKIPSKSIDCIYTDIPYLYTNGGGRPKWENAQWQSALLLRIFLTGLTILYLTSSFAC